jgi:hypothetical protein
VFVLDDPDLLPSALPCLCPVAQAWSACGYAHLSESPFANAAKEVEVEEVDLAVKVDRLG